MKKIIITLTGCVLAMMLGLSVAADTAKKAPSFMFVIQAKKGEITYNKKTGQHELVLNKADVHHVIMFSDRPYRIVKYITGKDLAADWSEGSNSFKVDPPNAVLSGSGMKAQIIILSSIHVKARHVIFGLAGYTGGHRLLADTTVAIDIVPSDRISHLCPSLCR